jgi:23S rRNA pseudouridine1911/1915/1917 synthase
MSDTTSGTFHATPEQAGRTLADALRGWLAGQSWSRVQRLIKTRHVMIDGNLCLDAGRRLNGKEVVKVLPRAAAPVPKDEDVRIRYLDSHLVVVEKPAGMTSIRHIEERRWTARRKQLQPTLDEALPRLIARQEGRGRANSDRAAGDRAAGNKAASGKAPQGKTLPGRGARGIPPPVRPVHRIDRDTSGLMVFARTVRAERALGLQFREHTIQRRYLAIVAGQVKAQTFDSVLVRDRGDGRRGIGDEEDAGKRAVTHVKPLEKLDGYTLVECRLETGRTHQIRIHLSEAGHPLCGDKVYRGPAHGAARIDRSGASRMALHAAELAFEHPLTGEPLQFSMPLPRDMRELLEKLRGDGLRPSEASGRA